MVTFDIETCSQNVSLEKDDNVMRPGLFFSSSLLFVEHVFAEQVDDTINIVLKNPSLNGLEGTFLWRTITIQ